MLQWHRRRHCQLGGPLRAGGENMSDEAFVASQLDIQMNEFDIASAKMKLYQIEQNNYYNLNLN
jgi:hypothetical protein